MSWPCPQIPKAKPKKTKKKNKQKTAKIFYGYNTNK
jgi:hypothetical protein